jgi:hypothetical protein
MVANQRLSPKLAVEHLQAPVPPNTTSPVVWATAGEVGITEMLLAMEVEAPKIRQIIIILASASDRRMQMATRIILLVTYLA